MSIGSSRLGKIALVGFTGRGVFDLFVANRGCREIRRVGFRAACDTEPKTAAGESRRRRRLRSSPRCVKLQQALRGLVYYCRGNRRAVRPPRSGEDAAWLPFELKNSSCQNGDVE